jgi:hypothetical protein
MPEPVGVMAPHAVKARELNDARIAMAVNRQNQSTRLFEACAPLICGLFSGVGQVSLIALEPVARRRAFHRSS